MTTGHVSDFWQPARRNSLLGLALVACVIGCSAPQSTPRSEDQARATLSLREITARYRAISAYYDTGIVTSGGADIEVINFTTEYVRPNRFLFKFQKRTGTASDAAAQVTDAGFSLDAGVVRLWSRERDLRMKSVEDAALALTGVSKHASQYVPLLLLGVDIFENANQFGAWPLSPELVGNVVCERVAIRRLPATTLIVSVGSDNLIRKLEERISEEDGTNYTTVTTYQPINTSRAVSIPTELAPGIH